MLADELWKRVLRILREEVNPQTFNTWFEPLSPVELNETNLVLETPHAFIRDWIEENYMPTLNRIVEGLAGNNLTIQILVNEQAKIKDHGKPDPSEKDTGQTATTAAPGRS